MSLISFYFRYYVGVTRALKIISKITDVGKPMYTVQVRGWVWACSNLSKTMRDLLFRTSNSTHKLVNYITSIQNNGKKHYIKVSIVY